MTNLDSILKSRDITLPTKVHLVKAMVFPAVMYGCESWTVKKAECRIDASELWCWRRLLRVPWTARRSNQSVLKEISPEFTGRTDAEAETPILWPHHGKSWLTGKDPDAGRDWGQEEKGMTEDEMVGWHHWLNGNGSGQTGMLQFMGSQRFRYEWTTERNSASWNGWPGVALLSFSPYSHGDEKRITELVKMHKVSEGVRASWCTITVSSFYLPKKSHG